MVVENSEIKVGDYFRVKEEGPPEYGRVDEVLPTYPLNTDGAFVVLATVFSKEYPDGIEQSIENDGFEIVTADEAAIYIPDLREAKLARKCPRCTRPMYRVAEDLGALSRADNETIVCWRCGEEEALEPKAAEGGRLTRDGKLGWPS